LPEECQAANSCVCRIHLLGQYFPHPHRVPNLVEVGLDFRAARSIDNSTSLSSSCGIILIASAPMNGSLGHSFGVFRFSFFSHDNSPSLDSMKDLFTVCLPAGVVYIVQKGDGAKRVLEDLLVRGVDGGHDDSIGGRVS